MINQIVTYLKSIASIQHKSPSQCAPTRAHNSHKILFMNEIKMQECTSPYLKAPKPSFHLKEEKKKKMS